MKRLEVYFDSYFIDKIREEMKEYGIEQYIIIPEVHSRWSKTLKHFNSHYWPGTDSVLITHVEDEVAKEIIAQYFGMNTTQVTEDTTAIPSVEIIN